ncbi:hypothetical protein ACGFZL_31940 [Streptomyces sp. NPDC048182]|uniref:hypothetical protein n=1 Tax=Streptomyces sp. NPDC048182 TaxID=3365507 RepID=UPI003715AACE
MALHEAGCDLGVTHTVLDDPPAHLMFLSGEAAFFHGGTERLDAAFAHVDAGRDLIVDVADLEYCDAPFLNALLGARTGHRLVIVGPLCASLERRLDVTGTRGFFDIQPTIVAALARLG